MYEARGRVTAGRGRSREDRFMSSASSVTVKPRRRVIVNDLRPPTKAECRAMARQAREAHRGGAAREKAGAIKLVRRAAVTLPAAPAGEEKPLRAGELAEALSAYRSRGGVCRTYVTAMRRAGYVFQFGGTTTLAHALAWLEAFGADFKWRAYLRRGWQNRVKLRVDFSRSGQPG